MRNASFDSWAIDLPTLVTKSELDAKLDLLRAEIRTRDAEARYRILRWCVAAAMTFQTIVIIGAFAALTQGAH